MAREVRNSQRCCILNPFIDECAHERPCPDAATQTGLSCSAPNRENVPRPYPKESAPVPVLALRTWPSPRHDRLGFPSCEFDEGCSFTSCSARSLLPPRKEAFDARSGKKSLPFFLGLLSGSPAITERDSHRRFGAARFRTLLRLRTLACGYSGRTMTPILIPSHNWITQA